MQSRAGSVPTGNELVVPLLDRSIIDEHVGSAFDTDFERRRVDRRSANRWSAIAPEQHSLTGFHNCSFASAGEVPRRPRRLVPSCGRAGRCRADNPRVDHV